MSHAKYQCITAKKKIFEDLSKCFYFAPYWAPKCASPFILTNLNSYSPGLHDDSIV